MTDLIHFVSIFLPIPFEILRHKNLGIFGKIPKRRLIDSRRVSQIMVSIIWSPLKFKLLKPCITIYDRVSLYD